MNRFRHLPAYMLAACTVLFFLPLHTRALWDPQEARLGEIVREMIELKSWILPQFNYTVTFDHLPLQYWLTAATMKLLGETAIAVRFWGALWAVLIVGLVYSIGRHWRSERLGLMAGGILASTYLFFGLTQYATLDTGLTFWLTLSLLMAVRLTTERTLERVDRFATLGAVALVGGFLAYGWVGLFYPMALFLLNSRDRRLPVSLEHFPWQRMGIIIFLLILPWGVGVLVRHPSFIFQFLFIKPVTRVFSDASGMGAPWYAFLPVLTAGFLPWAVFWPKVYASWISEFAASRKRDAVGGLLTLWAAGLVLLAMLTRSSSLTALMPALPALALLTASIFEDAADSPQMPAWVQRGVVSLILLCGAALFLIKMPSRPAFLSSAVVNDWVSQTGGLALSLAMAVFILVGVWGMRRTWACYFGVLGVQVLLLLSLASLAPRLDALHSAKALGQTIQERAPSEQPVVAVNLSWKDPLASFLFYSRRPLILMPEIEEGAVPPGTWLLTRAVTQDQMEQGSSDPRLSFLGHQGRLRLLQRQ